MIQIRAACKNKHCQYYADVQILNLPVVGRNIEAFPTLMCSGCRHIVGTQFIDPELDGILKEDRLL